MSDTATPATDLPPAATANGNGSVASESSPSVASGSEISKRLFIGNLPFRASYADIKAVFAEYNLTAVKLPKRKGETKDGQSRFYKRGFGFVELKTPEEAEEAMVKLHGIMLHDRPLEIKKAEPPKPKTPKSTESGQSPSEVKTQEPTQIKKPAPKQRRKRGPPSDDTVFLSNLPVDTTEEQIKSFFSALNPVEVRLVAKKERVIKSKNITKPARTLAFVKFADGATRQKAIDEYSGKELNGVNLTIKVAVEAPVKEDDTEATAQPATETAVETATATA